MPIVVCKNKTRKVDSWNEYQYKQCKDCIYLYTHLADHWMQGDTVLCKAPYGVEFGDRVIHIPERYRIVKRKNRKAKRIKK